MIRSAPARIICLFFILLFLSFAINPVFAVSYVDMERITIGELGSQPYYALEFDGSNDYANRTDTSIFDITGDTSQITCEVWLYPNTITGYHTILTNQENYLVYQHDGRIELLLLDGEGGYHNHFRTTYVEVVADAWQHIVIFYDGTGSTGTSIFIDNSSKAVQTIAFHGGWTTTSNHFEIGCRTYGSYSPLNGSLDEMRIYKRTINTTEINYSYNSGNGRYTPLNQTELIAWYHMDEGSGTSIEDASGNANHLTLGGDTDEWVTGKVSSPLSFPSNIEVRNLEMSYEVKLLNSTDGLITNGTANNEGTATLALPLAYQDSAFEGTFRIYDENASFIYKKWFEDLKGGDQFEMRSNIPLLVFGVVALVIGLFAIVFALARKK